MSKNSGANRKLKLAKKREKTRQTLAESQKKRLIMPKVYLDETGNTAYKLTDKRHPIFTMAGTVLNDQESERLLSVIKTDTTGCVDLFQLLKNSPSGQEELTRLLKHSLVKKGNFKVYLAHKSFYLTSRIVEMLIDTVAHNISYDLGKQYVPISNILHHCLPLYCGEANVEDMHNKFIQMMESRKLTPANAFYKSVQNLKNNCTNENLIVYLDLILASKVDFKETIKDLDVGYIDPLFPALIIQDENWSDEYPKGLRYIHEFSKTLDSQEFIFNHFIKGDDRSHDWADENGVEYGFIGLLADQHFGRTLKYANASDTSQLKLVKLIASSFVYWSTCIVEGRKDDPLFIQLDQIGLHKLIIDQYWPAKDFNPEIIGDKDKRSENSDDEAVRALMKIVYELNPELSEPAKLAGK